MNWYLIFLSTLLLSCVTKNPLNKRKNISEIEITHDEKRSLAQYLQLHETSPGEIEKILNMIEKSKADQKAGLHLAEEAQSQSLEQGKHDILVCAKAQAGFIFTAGGAYCHSTKNEKSKYISFVGAGPGGGANIGAFWIFYTDYNKTQLYAGLKLGLTIIAGLDGFAGYNNDYGSALGVGLNVGAFSEAHLTVLSIHPKKTSNSDKSE